MDHQQTPGQAPSKKTKENLNINFQKHYTCTGTSLSVLYSWASVVDLYGSSRYGIAVLMDLQADGPQSKLTPVGGMDLLVMQAASVIMLIPRLYHQHNDVQMRWDQCNTWSSSVAYYNNLVHSLTSLRFSKHNLIRHPESGDPHIPQDEVFSRDQACIPINISYAVAQFICWTPRYLLMCT